MSKNIIYIYMYRIAYDEAFSKVRSACICRTEDSLFGMLVSVVAVGSADEHEGGSGEASLLQQKKPYHVCILNNT